MLTDARISAIVCMEDTEMVKNDNYQINLFERLHNGEKIKCPMCGKEFIKPISNRPIMQEFCFECNNCKAHYRYDPVPVTVE